MTTPFLQYIQSTTGGGTMGGSGGDPLQSGPAYTLGGGGTQTNTAQNNFDQALNSALLANGINPQELSTEEQQQIQAIIYASPYLTGLTTQQGQQELQQQQSAYQGPYSAINAIANALSQTFFPNVGSLTAPSGVQSQDPAAASFGLQLKSKVTGIPQSTASQYQTELLAMGLPADLYSTYSGAVSAWEQFFSGPPTPQELAQLLGINPPGTGTGTLTGANMLQLQQQAEQAAATGPSTGNPPTQPQPTPPSGGGTQSTPTSQLNYAQLEGVFIKAWQNVNGNRPMPNVQGQPLYVLMAALAEAESGGTVGAENPSGAAGLWQLLDHPQFSQQRLLSDALYNAEAAVQIYNSQGLGAWETYDKGVYSMQPGISPDYSYAGGGSGPPPPTSTPGTATQAQGQNQVQLPDPSTITQAGMVDKIRQMQSNIPGLNMGQYSDIKQMADGIMQNLVGHSASDGVIASIANSGYKDTPSLAEEYLGSMTTGALDAMGSQVYNNIYAANQPTLQNVYNEQGFDPNLAYQQYYHYYQQNPEQNPVLQVPSHPPSHVFGGGQAPGPRKTVVS